MDGTPPQARAPRSQLVLIGAIFAAVLTLLALGYFLFLRTEYVVLAQGLRAEDSAAIVAELDKRHASYRLAGGGTTILVPEGDADATRVAIAGSEVAARGQIGFELFNKSDMGLTNFAQKINYQRALQGELVRTIMLMDGVDSARVHLALPERTLFRGDRTDPKAAVTVMMKPGRTADPARVTGIQRLVAASVPDLPESKVVVLDAEGRVISADVAFDNATARPADLEERVAVENYFGARARGAVERLMPGLHFSVRVLVMPLASDTPATEADAPATPDWAPTGDGAGRNYRLRITFVSEAPLNPEDQGLVRDAIVQATAVNPSAGDALFFVTGPVDPVAPAAQPAARSEPLAVAPVSVTRDEILNPLVWLLGLIGVIALALIVWRLRASGRARLSGSDHDAFAARLRRQLNLEDRAADASA